VLFFTHWLLASAASIDSACHVGLLQRHRPLCRSCLFFHLAGVSPQHDGSTFAESASPVLDLTSCFCLLVDDVNIEDFKKTDEFPRKLDNEDWPNWCNHVVLHAADEAGALWEKLVTQILAKHNFKAMMHEHNVCSAVSQGHLFLACHHVDNLAVVACADPAIAKQFIDNLAGCIALLPAMVSWILSMASMCLRPVTASRSPVSPAHNESASVPWLADCSAQ